MFKNSFKYLKICIFLVVWICAMLLVLQTYTTGQYQHIDQWLVNANFTAPVKLKLLVDTRGDPNDTDRVAFLQHELSNVPFEFWHTHRAAKMQLSTNCARAPSIYDLRFHNNYWQLFDNANITFRLFGAYLDARPQVRTTHVVRILAMINQIEARFPPSYCQLWFADRTTPTIVDVAEYKPIWFKAWGSKSQLFPHLLTCPIPAALKTTPPQAVSLVAKHCDTARNSLRVVFELPPSNYSKEGFAVCTKGLDYPYTDLSARLVEWLEMLRLLGARKVITYELALHPNMTKVLRHYVAEGFVELRPLTLATDKPHLPHYLHGMLHSQLLHKRLNEIIPYNDCFYRSIYRYEYVGFMDLDEIIMPLGNHTHWKDLIEIAHQRRQETEKGKCSGGYGAICVRNIHFPINPGNFTPTADVPPYMFMLQHDHRMVNHSKPGAAVKCLHNTSQAVALHNHFPISYFGKCRALQLNPEEGQLHHYSVHKHPEEWQEAVVDRSMYRYKEALVASVEDVLKRLGFLGT